MKILVNEKISQHKYKTPEGYLICVDSVLARTGNQTYRKNELFADSEDDSEIEVGRSPEEVFSAETLASFENKPITIEHPDEDVNVENYKDYSVGFVRDVKRGKFDGQDVILGTLVITDKDAIEGIENGEHVELSCGYDCDIEDGADGYQQKHIRGNHVALCEVGRAGIAKIIDSVEAKDERTSMTKEITKAISGLKSTLFKTDFAFESDAHGMTLTATDSYGIDPAEKSQAMRFVELDVKAIESRLSKITGYTVTIAKYSLYKERYSDPNAGLNCERIWLYGKKIRDSIGDVEVNDALKWYYVTYKLKGRKKSFKVRAESPEKAKEYIERNYIDATNIEVDEHHDWTKDAVEDADELKVPAKYDVIKSGSSVIIRRKDKKDLEEEDVDELKEILKRAGISNYSWDISGKYVSFSKGRFSTHGYIDSTNDADEPRLDRAQRRMLQNYLSMISTFTSRDTDIRDVLRPLSGKGFKYTIDKIEGWIWKKDEMAYKNYYISLDGYKDKFKVTLYADPNKDWKVTEVNAYFTDSKVKDYRYKIIYGNGKEEIIEAANEKEAAKYAAKKSGKWGYGIHNLDLKDEETPDEEQTTMLEKDLEHFDDAEMHDGKEVRYQGYVIQEYHPLHDDPDGDGYIISKNGIIVGGADSVDEAIKKINRKELKRDSVNDADVNDTVLNWKNTYLGEETDEIRLPQGSGSIIASYDDIRNKTRIRFLGGSRGSPRDDIYIKGKPKTLEQLLKYVKDSVNDVDPRSGESKDDFIARFMKETKNEYPDEKQRLAVAYSYWEKKGRDSIVKDINPDYANCLRELDKDVSQLYKLYQHGDKAPSTILHNMGYKEVGDGRFMMRSGLNKMIIEFDDFSDYIKYYVVDESGKIPRGYTVTKFKFYDSKAKDSIYSLTVQGQKSKKLVRAKDAREAIDKYTKMFPKYKVSSVKKTDKFNNVIEIIKR